jgi:hypothetical protein
MPVMPVPLLLTPEAARRKLGVSERGLRDLLKKGLPFIKVGKRRMFPVNDIAAWISEQVKCPNPASHISSTGARARRTGTSPGRSTVIGFDEALAQMTKRPRSS